MSSNFVNKINVVKWLKTVIIQKHDEKYTLYVEI